MSVLAEESGVDDFRFQSDMVAFATIMDREIGDVLEQQAKLLLLDMAKLTPPFDSVNSIEDSWGVQKKAGEHAVLRDINRIFTPLETLGISVSPKNISLQHAFDAALFTYDAEGMATILTRAKVGSESGVDALDVTFSVNPDHHQRMRRSRGRVTRSKSPPQNYVNEADLDRYIKLKQARVGKAKGGWAAGARMFGASLPAWVTRHASGNAINQARKLSNPFVRLINAVSYIANTPEAERLSRVALKNRIGAVRRQIEFMLKKNAP